MQTKQNFNTYAMDETLFVYLCFSNSGYCPVFIFFIYGSLAQNHFTGLLEKLHVNIYLLNIYQFKPYSL